MSGVSARLQTIKKAAPSQAATLLPARGRLLQRTCACAGSPRMDGECAACREKALGVQRLATRSGDPAVAPPNVPQVLGSPGQPLDAATRAFMEPRLGHDFSRVRVHTDAPAAASAWAADALAYTVGNDIVFGARRYAPGSREGDRLLAHELVHVIQQGDRPVSTQARLQVNEPEDRFEQEANEIADDITDARPTAGSPFAQLFSGLGSTGAVPEDDEPDACRFRGVSPGAGVAISRTPAVTLQRMASFEPGTVLTDLNEAFQIGTAGSAGRTNPTLNGTLVISRETAVAAINGPGISGRSTTSGAECWIDSVPSNIGSFIQHVPTNGPWTAVLPKATLAGRFGMEWGEFCGPVGAGSGDATLTAKGLPSDADLANEIRVHENQHAADDQRIFNGLVVPWDQAMVQAQGMNQIFSGADETACEAALFASVGGFPSDIATSLRAEMDDAGFAFHSTPAGKQVDHEFASSDQNCDNVAVQIHH